MTPFKYGKVVEPFFFVNREKEIEFLQRNFVSKINTILISPRRWGKSSLVKKATLDLAETNKKIVPCFLDLFNVRDEKEFYEQFSRSILIATYSKWEDRLRAIKTVFKTITPKITIGIDPSTEFELGFDINEIKKHPNEILNLAETISKLKKIEIVVCIDEFQNISHFENPLIFQKKLRAMWQHHHKACYCLYGSKRNMLTHIFEHKSMPFYKFGDVLFLPKIAEDHWVTYIRKQFKRTKKEITTEAATLIAQLMENHPYFVQQLARNTWEITTKNCTEETVQRALNELLITSDLLFQKEVDLLSNKQINFLKALVDEVQQFSTSSVIQKYDLGSSANVNRVRKALVDKEVVDIYGKIIEFIDPLFKQWMKRIYMA